ncbi:nicotinate phosphoribosyltransferase [Candidatus Berkiella aquae]|uniref:Nicotinate phosphoribosyltransferase n=1 Tax=Candidatus Berkiella aquae TaxID=295108 RepID=A0A0Q9Z1I1_9GAMM|nr:nicotinate phosphoribosyltransferase [Candidatus Berkiella aquae]MCS5712460.1 nicotinate phosphoribosyltransferase [Candidatus Berkiella aquae]
MAEPIIRSLLDTDLYKLTMMQCVMHQFPSVEVEYQFKSRKPLDLKPYLDEIQEQITLFCELSFTDDELAYLSSLSFFKPDFIEFLRTFRLQASHVHFSFADELKLSIKGPWAFTILFEVPLLAIISEIYYRANYPEENFVIAKQRLTEKLQYVKTHYPQLRFSDFGTRRRFSNAWHTHVIDTLQQELPEAFIGTSNIYFAKTFGLRPIGTMAHEYLQACQVLAPTLLGSQKFALEAWLKEYPHDLGIALTDVLTMDIFLQEFDASLAKHYQGLRQDSGDPFVWGNKALQHYAALGINAKEKSFVFSDNLNIPLAIEIAQYFQDKCYPVFGIGTNLTNDMGHPTLDIVIKMTYANQQPVIKISDSKGKTICEDPRFLQTVKEQFKLKD